MASDFYDAYQLRPPASAIVAEYAIRHLNREGLFEVFTFPTWNGTVGFRSLSLCSRKTILDDL
jgi:hypothetical protein